VPIFTGFGADAVAYRVAHSGARVLCTHHEYRDRVPPLPEATVVLTIGGRRRAGDVVFEDAMAGQPDRRPSTMRRRDDPAVLLYTSRSTGPPKGVKIATNSVLATDPYMRCGVDLRAHHVFSPTAYPHGAHGC